MNKVIPALVGAAVALTPTASLASVTTFLVPADADVIAVPSSPTIKPVSPTWSAPVKPSSSWSPPGTPGYNPYIPSYRPKQTMYLRVPGFRHRFILDIYEANELHHFDFYTMITPYGRVKMKSRCSDGRFVYNASTKVPYWLMQRSVKALCAL